jgi:hypothetical protein
MRRAALRAAAAARRCLAPPLRAPPAHTACACTATLLPHPLAARHAAYTARAGGSDAPASARDTIFALSTAPGRAALAVVRASGPGVRAGIAALLPRGAALPAARHASLVPLRDPGSGELLDRALLLLFPAPRSATGEDVAELQLHGGPAVVAGVLSALSHLPVRTVMTVTHAHLPALISSLACRAGGLRVRESLHAAPSTQASWT